MIFFYNMVMVIAAVLLLPLILPAILASGKLRRTFPYRLGLKALPDAIDHPEVCKNRKGPVWVHALSVGEVLSAVPLVKELKNKVENHAVFFSVSTLTGYEVACRRLTGIVDAIFFYPYDFAFTVRWLVKKISPSLVVIVETDIWPNFLNELTRRQAPVVLVNARLSKRSFVGYKRIAFFFRWVFSGFAKICAQSDLDAERFRRLGIPSRRIVVTGNVKFDQNDDPVSDEQLQRWRRRLKVGPGKKVWLAGSTHEGEEAVVRDVFIRLLRNRTDMTLIVAPRDPRRVPGVARLFREAGIAAALASRPPSNDGESPADVFIVDTIGDLRTLYALADMAFIGGSLAGCGGHNPLEPAAFSKPVLFGPDMSDFAVIAQMLIESGGALRVRDAEGLFAAVAMLMDNRLKAEEMGRNASRVFCENKGAVARILEIILNELFNK
ncbi:MAG: 3-deoxy-D-manno-octulosonic acid transferase [Thermodesulfobacteriota bacterium]